MIVQSNAIAKCVTFIFGIVFLFTPSLNVFAENPSSTKSVMVIGTGRIYKEDSASARKHAIENSLVSAVERVAVGLISPESYNRTFQKLNEALDNQTSKFVQDYKVLAEAKINDVYKVMVQANISVADLTKFLSTAGIMTEGKSFPKILILVSEQNLEDTSPKYWWGPRGVVSKTFSDIALAETLKHNGFPVINVRQIPQRASLVGKYNKPDLDKSEAVDIGRILKADVVIFGKATVERTQNVMENNVRSFKGVVSVRAVRTDTGEEIAATTQSSVTANANEAVGAGNTLSAAGTLVADTLSDRILSAWQKEEAQTNAIEIVVEGTNDMTSFEKFIRIIKEIPSVNNLQIKELKAKQAVVALEFKGNAKKLADTLMSRSYGSVGINIYEVSKNHLRIGLISGSS
ncbi:MAG: hypothetical protein LJE66_01595 [Desulfobacterales bacterium]|nr:hypothetical protein [Desulfobacterales bacterium]